MSELMSIFGNPLEFVGIIFGILLIIGIVMTLVIEHPAIMGFAFALALFIGIAVAIIWIFGTVNSHFALTPLENLGLLGTACFVIVVLGAALQSTMFPRQHNLALLISAASVIGLSAVAVWTVDAYRSNSKSTQLDSTKKPEYGPFTRDALLSWGKDYVELTTDRYDQFQWERATLVWHSTIQNDGRTLPAYLIEIRFTAQTPTNNEVQKCLQVPGVYLPRLDQFMTMDEGVSCSRDFPPPSGRRAEELGEAVTEWARKHLNNVTIKKQLIHTPN